MSTSSFDLLSQQVFTELYPTDVTLLRREGLRRGWPPPEYDFGTVAAKLFGEAARGHNHLRRIRLSVGSMDPDTLPVDTRGADPYGPYGEQVVLNAAFHELRKVVADNLAMTLSRLVIPKLVLELLEVDSGYGAVKNRQSLHQSQLFGRVFHPLRVPPAFFELALNTLADAAIFDSQRTEYSPSPTARKRQRINRATPTSAAVLQQQVVTGLPPQQPSSASLAGSNFQQLPPDDRIQQQDPKLTTAQVQHSPTQDAQQPSHPQETSSHSQQQLPQPSSHPNRVHSARSLPGPLPCDVVPGTPSSCDSPSPQDRTSLNPSGKTASHRHPLQPWFLAQRPLRAESLRPRSKPRRLDRADLLPSEAQLYGKKALHMMRLHTVRRSKTKQILSKLSHFRFQLKVWSRHPLRASILPTNIKYPRINLLNLRWYFRLLRRLPRLRLSRLAADAKREMDVNADTRRHDK